MEPRHAGRKEFERALSGVDFPASRSALLRAAQDKGGIDTEVPHILERIPDATYETPDDLFEAVEREYARGEGLQGAGPAAPPDIVKRPPQSVTD
jgi:hypothetical protein